MKTSYVKGAESLFLTKLQSVSLHRNNNRVSPPSVLVVSSNGRFTLGLF